MRRLTTLCCIIFLLGSSPRLFAAERDWQDCKSEDAGRSIAGCTRVIADKKETSRRRADAYYNRGISYSDKNDYDRAIADFDQAIRLKPGDKDLYFQRANAYFDRNKWDDDRRAIADYDRAIKLDRRFKDAYYNRGLVYLNEDKFEAALADFSQAIKLDPKDADGYAARASVLQRTGKPQDALPDAERAVQLDPESAFAIETRGEVFQALNRWDEAVADLERALAIEPDRKVAGELRSWLKAAAVPTMQGSCSPAIRVINDAYAGLTVEVERGTARVGDPVTLTWMLPDHRRDLSRPAYLVVSLPESVRLEGDGFYALSGASPGPYRMKFAAGRVRTISPLHTQFARGSGEIRVLPYAAGPLEIEWAVVGMDACGEWVAGAGRSETISISAGAPQLVLRDEYTDAKPDSVIAAAAGSYKALIFKSMVQVIDAVTGSVILQRQGTRPAFSPTGRFLSLKTPVAETYEVFDLLAARAIGRYVVNALFWSHGDSFLYLDGAHSGWLQIVRTLHGKRADPLKAIKTESHDFDDRQDAARPSISMSAKAAAVPSALPPRCGHSSFRSSAAS